MTTIELKNAIEIAFLIHRFSNEANGACDKPELLNICCVNIYNKLTVNDILFEDCRQLSPANHFQFPVSAGGPRGRVDKHSGEVLVLLVLVVAQVTTNRLNSTNHCSIACATTSNIMIAFSLPIFPVLGVLSVFLFILIVLQFANIANFSIILDVATDTLMGLVAITTIGGNRWQKVN